MTLRQRLLRGPAVSGSPYAIALQQSGGDATSASAEEEGAAKGYHQMLQRGEEVFVATG